MNNKQEKISLPLGETLSHSFMYAFTHLELFLKVSAIWFSFLIFEGMTNFPTLCSLNPSSCNDSWQQKIVFILMTLGSIGIVIAYCRAVILKAPVDYFKVAMLKRGLRYFIYTLLLFALVAIPSVVGVFIFAALGQMVGLADRYYDFAIIIPLIFFIYFSRILLAFPAIAVDNHELGLKASFKLTFGNANKIFWGQVIMMIPAFIAIFILSYSSRFVAMDNFMVKLIYVVLIYVISYFDSCLKASYLSHIYQYFLYFQNKNVAE